MDKKLSRFFSKAILCVGIIFLAILTIITFVFTTYISDYSRSTMPIKFAPYIIIGLISFFVILMIKPLMKRLEKINVKKLAYIVFFVSLIASILWVFIAGVFPMWDSLDVINAAGIVSEHPSAIALEKWSTGAGSYMERFPFQTPVVLLVLFCMYLAGKNFLIFFQLLNCLSCAASLYFIVKLTDALFKNKKATLISALLCLLFFPMVLYCTFIYGNTICMPFAIAAWYLQKLAIDNVENRRKFIKYLLLSILCAVISAFFKSTMIIVALALAVVWAVWGLQQKKKLVPLLAAILVVVLSKVCIVPLNAIISAKYNVNLQNGVPTIAWITMGLGGSKEYYADISGDDSIRNDTESAGYFDAFIWIHPDAEYSPENISKTSKEYLKKRVDHYLADPGLAAEYLGKKAIIEWTEPTFESFLASNWCTGAGEEGYPMCARDYTALGRSFYYGKANAILIFIMDTMQTVLACGALVCLVALRKKIKIQQLSPLVCILGGALLYLLWENKTQYIMSFYLFMIPYAGVGVAYLTTQISTRLEKRLWKRR